MANAGKYPVDLETPVGLVRTFIGDTDPSNIQGVEPEQTGTYLWYSDEELTALLGQYRQNPRRTAAFIMGQLAFSQSMKLKKWTSADLQVDGPAITEAILKAADRLTKDADREDEASGLESAMFIVPTGGIDWPSHHARYPILDPAIERWL